MTGWSGIRSDQIDVAAPYIAPFIERALEYDDGRYTLDHVLEQAKAQQWQIWTTGDNQIRAVVATQIRQYPKETRCRIVLAGGTDMALWLEHMSVIERWAESHGCSAIELVGRKGWMKALPEFTQTGVELRKRLSDVRRR